MDFYKIVERRKVGRKSKNNEDPEVEQIEIFPSFQVQQTKDLMVRGQSFFAIWDEANHIWSTNEYDVVRLVDQELWAYFNNKPESEKKICRVKTLCDYSTKMWAEFKQYMRNMSDNYTLLDNHILFKDVQLSREDYASKTLPYSLNDQTPEAYHELMSTLYDKEERDKLEWCMGSIFCGESKNIQKFVVLHGAPGSGKSTFLNIMEQLFKGYSTAFDARALTSGSDFASEVFKSNALVGIQHDGDLSKIEDNTILNSIVSGEEIVVNEKFKPTYSRSVSCMLFLASNKPVMITDARSGILRRLIDVYPSGRKVPVNRYQALVGQIGFELGAIANHCINVFRAGGKNKYISYVPTKMSYKTNIFFNFVESNFFIFHKNDGVSLKQAYDLYKEYCDDSALNHRLPKHKFRDELSVYFENYKDKAFVDGAQVRNYYSGFLYEKFGIEPDEPEEELCSLILDQETSILDDILKDRPAQYANEKGSPLKKWDQVTTTLKDIDTSRVHYVRPPLNHIVIDFDLKDQNGKKSPELNLDAASKWPPTYSEYSKSGAGIHLHYYYEGDPMTLSRIFAKDIEIKVYHGLGALRRKFAYSNNIPIALMPADGLPVKGVKMINKDAVKTEKSLRDLIERNLRKEIHPGTKPSIDFIHKILADAYSSGLVYDVTDMKQKILTFAMRSTNQAEYCLKLMEQMKFQSEKESEAVESNGDLIFFDVEVFPNLFVICWKFPGPDQKRVRMINPPSHLVEELLNHRLVGFNCRRYDNHILYGAHLGYSNQELYELSKRIINNDKTAYFREAYNLSYTDIYCYTTKKQSLKKWEIDLGIHHQELDIPWDQPVPEERWEEVADYCCNDVDATEHTFNATKADFMARQILADLSGLSVNASTQTHAAKIIFGDDPKPQEKFNYVDLSETFPGYKFDYGKSTYKGEDPSEGGLVRAKPGIYYNVAVLDVESMHPSSIEIMDLFGPYTKNFSEIKAARVAIKTKRYDDARKMLGGILEKYLQDESLAKDLSYALKIVINIVYGLTAAAFPNKFRDPRNKDNIVAKRGALFMIDLKNAVEVEGHNVVHIKTDSIKIADATPEIIQFVHRFGEKYGYKFEHETTYEKFCLVNDAVYIAKDKNGWEAVGAQFQHPYVFKSLFTKEEISFDDMCEAKAVKTALYLDLNEGLPEDEHNYTFVGKVGSFCPVIPGAGGGALLRSKETDGERSYSSATGAKGYLWMASEMVKSLKKEDQIDMSYFRALTDAAIDKINEFGDFDEFVNADPIEVPWI